MKCDWIILGSGIAGYSAAVTAHKAGRKAVVISRGPGGTGVASGAWSFGTPRANQHFDEFWSADETHSSFEHALCPPIKSLSASLVREQCQNIAQSLENDLATTFRWERPLQLPTSAGGWRLTYGAQTVQAWADRDQMIGKRVGLVGGTHWRWPFREVASQLTAGIDGLAILPCEIRLPDNGFDWPIPRLFSWIEHTPGARSLLAELFEKLIRQHNLDMILLPPLLAESARKELEKLVSKPIAECLATTEPCAGYRLTHSISSSLKSRDILHLVTNDVVYRLDGGRVQGVTIGPANSSTTLTPSNIVVATGKLFGGGVELGYSKIRETVFGLPLFLKRSEIPVQRRSEIDWNQTTFGAAQPWAKLGLWTNGNWVPRDETGRTVIDNVRACGTIIGGVDWAREGIGLGFSVISGTQCIDG